MSRMSFVAIELALFVETWIIEHFDITPIISSYNNISLIVPSHTVDVRSIRCWWPNPLHTPSFDY